MGVPGGSGLDCGDTPFDIVPETILEIRPTSHLSGISPIYAAAQCWDDIMQRDDERFAI